MSLRIHQVSHNALGNTLTRRGLAKNLPVNKKNKKTSIRLWLTGSVQVIEILFWYSALAHHSDVISSAMTSQITGVPIVC